MKLEQRTLMIDKYQIPYTLQYKNIKRIILKVDQEGHLFVVSNPFIPIEKIEAFLISKVQWIIRKQEAAKQKEDRNFHSIVSDEFFYFMDKKLKIVLLKDTYNRVHCDSINFYVHYTSEKQADETIRAWIRKQCEKQFPIIVTYYMEMLKDYHLAYPNIKFRDMKSRWGSCIPSKKQITLNTRLLHYPKVFVEYVVLHELVHFIKPNHSKAFYQLISYYMPDYKERIARL